MMHVNNNTSPSYPPSSKNCTNEVSPLSSDSDKLMVDIQTGLLKADWREWFPEADSLPFLASLQPSRALHEPYDANQDMRNELSFAFTDGHFESKGAKGLVYDCVGGTAPDPHAILTPHPNTYSIGGTPSRRTETTSSVYTDKIITIDQCGFSLSWNHKATVVSAILVTFGSPGISRPMEFFVTRDPQATELLANVACGKLDVALPCIVGMVNGDQFLIVHPGTFAYRASPGFISPLGFAPSSHLSRPPGNVPFATEVFCDPFLASSSSLPPAPQPASPVESSDTDDSGMSTPSHVTKIPGPEKRGKKYQQTPVALCDFLGCRKPGSGEKPELNRRHVDTPQHSNQLSDAYIGHPLQMLECSWSDICDYKVSRKDTLKKHEQSTKEPTLDSRNRIVHRVFIER